MIAYSVLRQPGWESLLTGYLTQVNVRLRERKEVFEFQATGAPDVGIECHCV